MTPYFNVLEKFLKFLLFDDKTQLDSNSKIFPISASVLAFHAKYFEFQYENQALDFASNFLKNKCDVFYSRCTQEEKENLLSCYITSDFKLLRNQIKSISSSSQNPLEDLIEQDQNLYEEVITQSKYPKVLRSYLIAHFQDVFEHISFENRAISSEEYEQLKLKYLRHIPVNEILDRLQTT